MVATTVGEVSHMATALLASGAQVDAISRRASAIVQAVAALLLGALVIGVAGFSHLDIVHNAAHDTRHANGFPCH
jgi:cobalt transporter subunit CbtB